MAGIAVALAACGSSSPGATGAPGGGGGGAGKTASCGLASPSLVKQALGLDVAAAEANDNGTVLVCTYQPAAGATGVVLIRYDTGSSAAQFKATRDGYATQKMETKDYPGFVDEAYTNTISAIGITTNTLDARKGSVEILISSGASFDQEKALEQQLFDALA
jgi:hypothetical protein